MEYRRGNGYIKPNGISTENMVHGGLFHRDLSPKKSALALKELFEKQWHTECELVTDENGYAALRGFYGDYAPTSMASSFPLEYIKTETA